jgi:hypothetical protein
LSACISPRKVAISPRKAAALASITKSVHDELNRHSDLVYQNSKDITQLQIEMAKRTNACPLVDAVNNKLAARVEALEEIALKLGCGYKAMAMLSSSIKVVLLIVYHFLNIGRLPGH